MNMMIVMNDFDETLHWQFTDFDVVLIIRI